MEAPEHVTWAGVPEEGRAAKLAAEVARGGWSLVGALDGNLTGRLRRAVDEVAARCAGTSSRDVPFEDVPAWAGLAPGRRQLLGDKTADPFYWAPGELPLDSRPSTSSASSV